MLDKIDVSMDGVEVEIVNGVNPTVDSKMWGAVWTQWGIYLESAVLFWESFPLYE
jgi:hypothetical protein